MGELIQKSEVRKENRRRVSDAEAKEMAEQASVDAGKLAVGEEVKAGLDEVLDMIDEVLESDAQAFVESFQQKGGE